MSRHLSEPETETRWCPTCGSIVPPDRDSCPHCGMPMPRVLDVPDPLEPPEDDIGERPTRFLPRLDSAIPDPSALEDETPGRDRSTLAIVVAGVCALVVVGVAILLIAHPWDPHFYDTRAQVPADTSMEGFPGEIDRLQGQDTDVAELDGLEGADLAYRELVDALDALDGYAADLDEEYRTIERDFAAAPDVREDAAADAHETAIEISNLIAHVQDLDTSSGVYIDVQSRLIQLGNYLRNRVDALTGAWGTSLDSDDPEVEKLRTLDEAQIENERYAGLFESARRELEIPAPSG